MLNLKKIVPKWSILVEKTVCLILFSKIIFEDVWNDFMLFLKDHPGETIIMQLNSHTDDDKNTRHTRKARTGMCRHQGCLRQQEQQNAYHFQQRCRSCDAYAIGLRVGRNRQRPGDESGSTSLTTLVMTPRFDRYAWALFCLTFTTSTGAMIPSGL